MDRSLVIVELSDRGRELIELAGEIAAGVDCELLLVLPIDESAYEEEIRRKTHAGSDVKSEDAAVTEAKKAVMEVAEELLDGTGVNYETRGFMGSLPNDLLTLADTEKCDHVFVTGEKRSPAGKAVFGDTCQRMLLNFDGPVTSLIE